MARKHLKSRKSKKSRTHKVRRHRGGGWGFTGSSSIPGTAGTVSNPMVYTGIGDCRAVKPGYDIPVSQYGASMKGLPGMSGGGCGMRSKRNRKSQKGGRYGFFPEGDPNPSGQAWWAGSYAPVQRIACEGTTQNPLNPTHTPSTAPAGAASPNYYMVKGQGVMSGGGQMAPATYGVGNVDSMYYYAPTAGYANTASTWKDSVGAPVQIQVPFAARSMNQACLTTGGHPPLTGALQKGGKRTRKHRGGGIFDNIKSTFSGIGQKMTNALTGKKANTLTPAVGSVYNNVNALGLSNNVAGAEANSNSNSNSNSNNSGNGTPIAPPPAAANKPADLVMGGGSEWNTLPNLKQKSGMKVRRGSLGDFSGEQLEAAKGVMARKYPHDIEAYGGPMSVPEGFDLVKDPSDNNREKLRKSNGTFVTPSTWKKDGLTAKQAGFFGLVYKLNTAGGARKKKSKSRKGRKGSRKH